jgi:hypothetical protein
MLWAEAGLVAGGAAGEGAKAGGDAGRKLESLAHKDAGRQGGKVDL